VLCEKSFIDSQSSVESSCVLGELGLIRSSQSFISASVSRIPSKEWRRLVHTP
jgi:hypothetical protein